MVGRVLTAVLIAALALAPAVGYAASDLSASPAGKHHGGRLHHQPNRAWRSTPTTLTAASAAPAVAEIARVTAVEISLALPLVVRVPFVPPRG
jgi:hypothetical protein